MKRHILLVISNLEFGGAQRQIVELVNNMNQDLFDIHVCSLSHYVPLAEHINKNITVHIVNKNAKFDVTVVYKLIKLIKRYRIDVIHSFLFDAEIAGRLSGRLSGTGVKVIGSERNTDYQLKKIQSIVYQMTKNMVDIIVANSTAGAAFNAKHTGVAPEKYRVVYNGVDTSRFNPADKQLIRQELEIDPDIPLIGMFASFKQQKNHPFLLKAVKELIDKHPKLKILFVGDMLYGGMHGSDDYHVMIKTLITDLGLDNVCISIGNRNDVERVYPACDFTVLPSLFEGTPNVLLESMACGIPVIATRVSDNEKIVAENESGFLVDLNDVTQLANAIDTLLSDKKLLKGMGIHARKRMIELFSSKRLAENMEQIYSS